MTKKILLITHEYKPGHGDTPFTILPSMLKNIFGQIGYSTDIHGTSGDRLQFIKEFVHLAQLVHKYDYIYLVIDGSCQLQKYTLLKLIHFRVKVIWEIHGPPEELLWWSMSPFKYLQLVKRQFSQRVFSLLVSRSISTTAALNSYAKNTLRIPVNYVIPSFVDLKRISQLTSNTCNKYPINTFISSGDYFRVFWGGGANYQWNSLDTIEQAAELIYKLDKSIIFIIVGSSPWHTFTNNKNMIHLSSLSEMAYLQFVKIADICLAVYKKQYEFRRRGFTFYLSPRKIVEYMSLKKVVIASRNSEITKLISHRLNGYIINDNPRELARAIINLKKNTDLSNSIRENAYKTILQHRTLESVIHIYKRALQP